MTSNPSQIDNFAERLGDESLDLKTRLQITSEIREFIESLQHIPDTNNAAAKIVPSILSIIEHIPPNFNSTSLEHRLRNAALDLLHRLWANEGIKAFVPRIIEDLMNLLYNDNEENGLICTKILTNLYRSLKDLTPDQIQPFLDFVIELYKNTPQVVKETFTLNAVPSAGNTPISSFQSPRPLSPSTGSDLVNETSNKQLLKCLYSFKVLIECPIMVVLIINKYNELVVKSLTKLIPQIIEVLKLQASPQARAHAAAQARGELYTSISPQIKNRTAYGDFITAQVKTMSFISYTLRHFPTYIKDYRLLVPDFIVRLLQDCPCELSPARKELLVATRHMLSVEGRDAFIPKIDVLLDEDVLIGRGLTARETLRPLAYSNIADLVHHVRAELSPSQVWKTVHVYCKNIQDVTLPTSVQIMSAKLLTNLVDHFMKMPDKAEGRQIMFIILNAFVERFTTLNKSYDHIMKSHKRFLDKEKKNQEDLQEKYSADIEVKLDKPCTTYLQELAESKSSDTQQLKNEINLKEDKAHEPVLFDPEDLDLFDVLNEKPIQIQQEQNIDELKEARNLFKNFMKFLKTVIYGLKSCNPPPPNPDIPADQWTEAARIFNFEQITIFRNFFRQGIAGYRFFASSNSGSPFKGSNIDIQASEDEKELMETFLVVFIHIDPDSFNEIVDAELPFLYESLFTNPTLLYIPHFLLVNSGSSANFTGILINFLKKKLPELGSGDPVKANILLRLFKLCFMAVNLYPQTNEAILLPHLNNLIVSCLELTTTAKDPIVYFHVLRSLFRSIGGQKFEKLHQEVIPLLQLLLASLNNLLTTARKPQERDIYVELCLSVPVRLTILVPHLSYLMRPLVIALNGGSDLVGQGLRTFELCVDNLTAEYFDPILEPVVGDIMQALFKHLKPTPHNHQHSHICLRILGKLGGRNRKYIQSPTDLENLSLLQQEVSVMLDINGLMEKKPLKITPAIQYALITLEDTKTQLHYRVQAYKYLSTALKLMIDTTPPTREYIEKIHNCVEIIKSNDPFPESETTLGTNSRADTKARRLQNELFERLLQSIFYATSVPEIHDEALNLITEMCEHCVLLELGELMIEKRKGSIQLKIDDHEGAQCLDPKALLGAIVYALCHYLPEISATGQKAIRFVFEAGMALFRSPEYVHRFPMFKTFFGKLSHTCFEEQYFRKAGACLGLKTLIKDLGLSMSWIKDRQLEFVRTMFFVLKDIPNDVPSHVRTEAKSLLLYVLEECNKNITEAQRSEKPYTQLTGLLAYQLANSNEVVRETSQEALAVLSKVTGKTISQIISPVENVLLPPIFTKPLRALPFPMQIGHIDAITFCLGLPDTFLKFNTELDRLMQESLALVEADDNSLASAHKAKEHRTAEFIVQLRIGSIKLLSLALTLPQYEAIQQTQRRSKIMSVFFKTLYIRSKKVVDAAHTGLRIATHNNRLPKDILSNGLRPILVSLSDPSRLSIEGLEGLARLLEALTTYFKVEIGNKLLDHLKYWADSPALQQFPSRPFAAEKNIKIITAILNVFHLLPSGADIFMESLVTTLFGLENTLRRQHSSPFREPIAKFLNRYSAQSFKYFTEKLNSRQHGRLFSCMLQMDLTGDLRKYCKEHLEELTKAWKDKTEPEEFVIATCNFIYVIRSLTDHDPDWIVSCKDVFPDLFNLHDVAQTTKSLSQLSPVPLQVDQAIDDLQYVVSIYLQKTHDFDILVKCVSSVYSIDHKVTSYIQNFIFDSVISGKDMSIRRNGLLKALEAGTNKASNIAARTFFFKNIINPTLAFEGKVKGNLNDLLEKPSSNPSPYNLVDQIHEKIWKSSGADQNEDGTTTTIDSYRFELLNMSALLIKLGSSIISDAKKVIIKFGWSYIKMEDIVSKQSAYVLIAYFIAAYETLSKIVVQIYTHLLRYNQNEAKILVRQALDLLAPVLKERTGSPVWAKWPRRVITEDSINVNHASNIYYFIVRHPKLFFEYRDHFISSIIFAMPKLSMFNSSNTDAVNLAIDLADLILTWETMAMEQEPVSRKRSLAQSEQDSADTSDNPLHNYTIPSYQREACITFLVRFICANNQRITEIDIGKKVVGILYRLLGPGYWPEIVKLQLFDKYLASADYSIPKAVSLSLNSLLVIGITIARKPPSWIVNNISQLHGLLQKPLKCDHIDILEASLNVVVIILDAIKADHVNEEDDTPAVTEFVNLIYNTIQENFSSNNSLACAIMLSWALVRFRPTKVDPLLPAIMKVFVKLSREHTGATAEGQAVDSSMTYSSKVITKLILMILDIGSVRISSLNDQRRCYLSVYVQLIDRSPDKSVGLRTIEIARNWVFSTTDLFPPMKEKAVILSKMLAFEIRGDKDLSKKFFELLIDIYTDPRTSRSDLSLKMEKSFMMGTKATDIEIRQKLMKILNDSLDDSAIKRLNYVIGGQNWEHLQDYQWTNQALQILYKGLGPEPLRLRSSDFTTGSLDLVLEALPKTYTRPDASLYATTTDFVKRRIEFVNSISKVTADDFFAPIVELQYKSPDLVHHMWVNLFPQIHSGIPKKDRIEFVRSITGLLSKDYHMRQSEMTPNVILTLLDGVSHCDQLQISPLLVKYLGKTYNAWYPSIQILENISSKPLTENFKISQVNLDALIEMYAGLQEDDMFYGQWRRRSKYTETNTALSYEQAGLWSRAIQMYENAQIKARSGALPYNESEYSLWEDHWIICAQKLQQWDILVELAKHEGFTDLLLECGWRAADWTADKEPLEQSIKAVMDVPTPRRQVFETFLHLQGYANETEDPQEVYKYCDEGIQLALRKWSSLPSRLTGAHIPLLHIFQQYVEFLEASQVYSSLHKTDVHNLDSRSSELKGVLKAWRERLPNLWDDIDLWGDLVTWRKHAFNVINKTYDPLIRKLPQPNSNSNSYAYRGYHETAWIINRFAHVARKHGMLDVCLTQLNIIYNLPNIEIQEAFLKLREQAKCYYKNPNEYQTGLDVINNTNLAYFTNVQKAEFLTLKGMFYAKLNHESDAQGAFSAAVQVDLYLPKAWAEWGYFHDRIYQKKPQDIKRASSAIHSYLQAAGLYKNGKTRKLLSRILWLISIEDDTGEIALAFESYKGEVPVWYWITFIPQLLTALSHKEGKFAYKILIRIARAYPQALHFHLRTAKEDFHYIQRQALHAQNVRAGGRNGATTNPQVAAAAANMRRQPGSPNGSANGVYQPWDYTEEIMKILKTAYPLLSLSLETLVDQIFQRFKCSNEEDTYRLVMALLNECVQFMGRLNFQMERPFPTEANLAKFSENTVPDYAKVAFEKDFLKEKPEFDLYLARLRKWRDRIEEILDRRPGTMNLEALSPHLSEFHYQKFEDVEVPGQYSELKDENLHFVKIDRFMPTVDLVRGFGQSYKRIKILGHNGNIHMFAVQYPSGKQCRREERVVQLFKILNGILTRKKETRRRNINFTLPTAIPFSPHFRIIQDDPQYISMHSIYEEHCRRVGRSRDEPLDYATKKLRGSYDPKLPKQQDIFSIRMEILGAIQATIVPSTILRDYFSRTYATFEMFWLFRKQFSYQFAGVTFMTFLMSIGNRYPHKYFINTSSGAIWTTEMLPLLTPRNPPQFHNPEHIPFRLTPNIQTLMGPTALEGIFSVSVMVIAKCLTETAHELDQYISVFVREELISWHVQQQRPSLPDAQLREFTVKNVGHIGKRASSLAQVGQGNIPANQTVIDLISQAVNPRFMVATDNLWMPYF